MSDCSVHFRRGSLKDVRSIISLFKSIAPRYSRTETYYRWAHFEHPIRPSRILIGTCGAAVVAHVAICAVNLPDGRIAGFPQQVLVHPDYRSFAVIAEMLQEINRIVIDEYDFGIGFPNTTFAPVLEKIGRWTRQEPISDIVIQPRMESDISATSFFEHLLFEEDMNDSTMLEGPSVDWLRWRYFSHPTEHYDIVGEVHDSEIRNYAVLKVFETQTAVRVGHIIEAGWSSHDFLAKLQDSILSWVNYHTVSRVTTWETSNHLDLLSSIGSVPDKNEYEPVVTNLYTFGADFFSRAGLSMGVSDAY